MLCMGALLFAEKEQTSGDVLICDFATGKVELISKNKSSSSLISNLEINSSLPHNSILCTGKNSLCEISDSEDFITIRLGSDAIIESVDKKHLSVLSGSFIVCLQNNSEFTIKSRKSTLQTSGKYTAIVECTSNGGFKFIPLEGKGKIIPQTGEQKDIYRGRLTMVLGSPSKLGNAYDIDLLLLLKSSRLINSFPTPLPTMKRISLAVYAQQLKLKGKFNALIGDAPTDDNLQMWAFGKEDSEE